MPSVSDKQAKFMNAVAHNKEFAKKAGVPQKVGKEFAEADKKIKYAKDDTRNGRLHDVKTDRGTFRFKDNRRGE